MVESLRRYVLRTAHSPRWKFLQPSLSRLLSNAPPEEQWLRVVYEGESDRLVRELVPRRNSALEISGKRWASSNAFDHYRSVEYPDFDICREALDEQFDLIIAEQVFEHLLWPYRAAQNVLAMLNDSGRFLICTPFMVRVHNHPVDCTRWTETGLRHFLIEAGFSENHIVTGSWGNRECVRANLSRWVPYRPGRHSLANEAEFPVVVWALAGKRSEVV
jgi:hypothetical protein